MKYELVNKIWSAYQTFLMNAQKLFAFNRNKMLWLNFFKNTHNYRHVSKFLIKVSSVIYILSAKKASKCQFN